ncbi:MAG: TetR/AcrR family transcriptional regulator [Leptospiraceae bacterium]|nr:TetR/AcrR family transcriptional regulator [Leptospiraceae bacterium]
MSKNPKKTSESAKSSYHHGNLYEILIQHAEDFIRNKGFESFSLRTCAKEAGVSHSAPGHYFKDVSEILTEIAARFFERLALNLKKQVLDFPSVDPLKTISMEYVRFALEEPKLFYLTFHSSKIDRSSTRYQKAGDEAFLQMVLAIDKDLSKRNENMEKIRFVWSLIHGLAMLSIDGPMVPAGGKRYGLNIEEAELNIRNMVECIRNWKKV